MKIRTLLLAALLAAPLRAQDDVDARARARVQLALSETLDSRATADLVNAFDDKDETVRLAAAVAACHSMAVSQSVFTYALGTVHTSFRPALTKPPNQQDWTIRPEAVSRVVTAYLPRDLPPARLARLKAAAIDVNNLSRDASQFLLSRDAYVSPALAREVDAILHDDKVRVMYRIELAAMCIDRLGVGVLPVVDGVNARDGEAAAAVHALMMMVIQLPGGTEPLGKVAEQPAGDAAEIAAATLIEHVRTSENAKAALKHAYRSPTIQPKVREYIAQQADKLKNHQ